VADDPEADARRRLREVEQLDAAAVVGPQRRARQQVGASKDVVERAVGVATPAALRRVPPARERTQEPAQRVHAANQSRAGSKSGSAARTRARAGSMP